VNKQPEIITSSGVQVSRHFRAPAIFWLLRMVLCGGDGSDRRLTVSTLTSCRDLIPAKMALLLKSDAIVNRNLYHAQANLAFVRMLCDELFDTC
jgi:hypothetical protein